MTGEPRLGTVLQRGEPDPSCPQGRGTGVATGAAVPVRAAAAGLPGPLHPPEQEVNPRGVLSPVPLRPDLPGVVHGIVGRDPWVVQCDGCGLVQTHGWLTVAGQNICFDPEDTGRRLCPGCRAAERWTER